MRRPAPALLLAAALAGCGGGEERVDDVRRGDQVRYERPGDVVEPFTPAAISDGDCDRERLIRALGDESRHLREWTPPLAVEPTAAAIARYVRALHPVTLTRDTRVTNHALRGGRRVIYQSILAAGTPVLVNKNGNPVVRCRSGSPLAAPEPAPAVGCRGCPAGYRLPRQCRFYGDRPPAELERLYPRGRYSGADYDARFARTKAFADCYGRSSRPPPAGSVELSD